MKNLATLATAALVAVGLASTAVAAPPTVILTGGGIVQNTDSGLPGAPADLTSIGGFVAIAKGPGAINARGALVWTNVKGQIQAKLFAASNPTQHLSTLHGKVVCIALLPGGIPGMGDYEVRFVVTRSSGDFPAPVGAHGSLFVNDSGLPSAGGTDMADENFDPTEFDNAVCDTVGGSAHEPVVAGNFTVH
jgi:hypothetical protein